MSQTIRVARLNHAVLFVRDLEVAIDFYQRVFGFELVAREAGGRMGFLRAAGSDNHHDLGLMAVAADAPRPPVARRALPPRLGSADDR